MERHKCVIYNSRVVLITKLDRVKIISDNNKQLLVDGEYRWIIKINNVIIWESRIINDSRNWYGTWRD
jgi:hypothetical protein